MATFVQIGTMAFNPEHIQTVAFVEISDFDGQVKSGCQVTFGEAEDYITFTGKEDEAFRAWWKRQQVEVLSIA